MENLPDLITAVMGVLIALGSGLAWWIRWRDSQKSKISRKAADLAAVSGAMGETLEIVQTNLTREIERQTKYNEQQATTNERLLANIDELREGNRECFERLSVLEESEGFLVSWIVTLHSGIENGSIPPLPDVPSVVREILTRFPTQ